MGLSMGFFRMQNCRLAHSIRREEKGLLQASLPASLLLSLPMPLPPPLLPRLLLSLGAGSTTLGTGKKGGRKGRRKAGSVTVQNLTSLALAFFYFFIFFCAVTLDPAFYVTKMSSKKGNALSMGSGASIG